MDGKSSASTSAAWMHQQQASSNSSSSSGCREDDEEDTQLNLEEHGLELVASVGSSSLVGDYLQEQAELWVAATAVPSLAVQLEKAGIDRTESVEVGESLRALSDRYCDD
mmetsp:Transcript_20012/g.34036  ORF Transcript_20012/g.34036 Transcript_20012/m.34036 type:complete len:110 (-) Transcript_20012:292-621(-)